MPEMTLGALRGRQTQATGDIGLAAALCAMGVPPATERPVRPVKSDDGQDFVRIYFEAESIDGKHETEDLIALWGMRGAGVRNHPQSMWARLQIWSKSRATIVSMQHGVDAWVGLMLRERHQVLLKERDLAWWLDTQEPGPRSKLTRWSKGLAIHDAGLAAALATLGVVVTCRTDGLKTGLRFDEESMRTTIGAEELLRCWPDLPSDKKSPAAYMAAAEQNRQHIERAVREQVPDLMMRRGSAVGLVCPELLDEGDRGALEVVRRFE